MLAMICTAEMLKLFNFLLARLTEEREQKNFASLRALCNYPADRSKRRADEQRVMIMARLIMAQLSRSGGS